MDGFYVHQQFLIMSKHIAILLIILIVPYVACHRTCDMHSDGLKKEELLKMMRKVERVYVWNNIRVAFEYPELIFDDAFEGLPSEWKQFKRNIRKGEFDLAYDLLREEVFEINASLRYVQARICFSEIADAFYHEYEDVDEACRLSSLLGREIGLMPDYTLFEQLLEN